MSSLSATPSPSDNPLSLAGIANQQERAARDLSYVRGQLHLVARAVFALMILLSASLAAMATPLTRRRMGLLAALVHGGFGSVALGVICTIASAGPLGAFALLLWPCHAAAAGAHVVRGVRRLYARGPAGHHVHRWSGGEPRPMLDRISDRVCGMAGITPDSPMLREAALLGVLAGGIALVEIPLGLVTGSVPVLGVWLVLLVAMLGLLGYAAALRTRDAWRMQVLLDHEHEQRDLADQLAERSASSAPRGVEGSARITPPTIAQARSSDAGLAGDDGFGSAWMRGGKR